MCVRDILNRDEDANLLVKIPGIKPIVCNIAGKLKIPIPT
jgi:hypothetical protein